MLLVRKETTPDDIHGMDVASGILTAIGGKSSHAAVVARGMGRPCVVGASGIRIDEQKKVFTAQVGGKTVTVKEGDFISLDGTTGDVYLGQAKSIEPESHATITSASSWAGPTSSAANSAFAPTPIFPATPKSPASSAPKASASAAPSTCSSPKIACRSCRR